MTPFIIFLKGLLLKVFRTLQFDMFLKNLSLKIIIWREKEENLDFPTGYKDSNCTPETHDPER